VSMDTDDTFGHGAEDQPWRAGLALPPHDPVNY
jgi:hypothetical protein